MPGRTGSPRRVSTLDALLGPEIDAVYISTTNELHLEQALAAAKAGKHVLCEKPLALTSADARKMVAACTRGRRRARHQPPSAQCRRASGDARGDRGGPHRHSRSPRACSTPSTCREHLQGWRIARPEAGGGVVLDITVHDADTLRFVLGDDPVEVTAFTQSAGMAASGLEDGAMCVWRFKSGVHRPVA